MNQPPVASLGPDFPLRPGLALASAYERHGPVFRIESPGSFVYVLIGPEANRIVLGTQRAKFSNEQGWQRLQRGVDLYGRGLTFLDGEEHAAHRHLMSPSLRIDQAEAHQPAVRRAVSRAANHWEPGKQVSLYEAFFRITFETVAESFLGVTSEPEVTSLMEAFQVLEVLQRVRVPQSHHLAAEHGAIRRIREVLIPVLRLRRSAPGTDLLSHLASARQANGNFALGEDALLAEANQLLLAGHLTTSSQLSWLFYLLLRHPDFARQAHDPDVLGRIMLETERLYPPIGHLPRVTTEDVEFAGYQIPKGSFVTCSIVGCHYLPGIFATPDRFDPSRFAPPREEHRRTPFALVGFSAGPRRCLGVHFAKAQLATVATEILGRFELQLLSKEVQCRYQPFAYPVDGLPVRIVSLRS